MKRSVQILTRLLKTYLDESEDIKETLDDYESLMIELCKEGEYEKKLAQAVNDIIHEKVSEKFLCPICFSALDVKTYPGDYWNPPEHAIFCTECDWYK